MSNVTKTVSNGNQPDTNNYLNPIYSKQLEGVAKMRAALLACDGDNTVSLRQSIQNITAMRVYHQLTRIIKYTELMDELEEKLYESIRETINNTNSGNATTWMALLSIQEKLQKAMVDSHKLLQPYLDVAEFTVVDLVDNSNANEQSTELTLAVNSASRDNIRIKAQAILSELEIVKDNESK